MRPSRSITNPDPVPRPTWIITVAGSTRCATSTVLALPGGGGTGVRVTPGVVGADGLVVVAEDSVTPSEGRAAIAGNAADHECSQGGDRNDGGRTRTTATCGPAGRIAVAAGEVAAPVGASACTWVGQLAAATWRPGVRIRDPVGHKPWCAWSGWAARRKDRSTESPTLACGVTRRTVLIHHALTLHVGQNPRPPSFDAIKRSRRRRAIMRQTTRRPPRARRDCHR